MRRGRQFACYVPLAFSNHNSSVQASRPITIYGNGKQVRDVLYVGNPVDAFDLFLASKLRHEVFNMGGGPENTLSLLELLDLLKELAAKEIEPVIKVRKNSSGKSDGCMPRKLMAQEYLKNPKAWKSSHQYGQRWMAETAFSTFKRLFGEYASSIKFKHMAKEMIVKALLYNIFTAISPTI